MVQTVVVNGKIKKVSTPGPYTIGGNGKGRTISLDITQYSNDEKIIPMNVTLGTDYKEGVY